MPTLSAPRLNGQRPSHFCVFLDHSVKQAIFARDLCSVANGTAADWLRNFRLLTLQKPNGVRHIAIGEMNRRIAATALNELFLHNNDVNPCNQLALLNDNASKQCLY